LPLQLTLSAAQITDPGYRHAGDLQFSQAITRDFAQMHASPNAALGSELGGILSDNDPRFTTQSLASYQTLNFAKLKTDIADRLDHGALEIGLTGDLDETAAIAAVAKTFGALPPREANFRPYTEQRSRQFTADHTPRIIRHTGPTDQALIRMTWATRDDSDPVAKQMFNLLGAIVQIETLENLRQKLGKAYSPGARSDLSRIYRGYGTFAINATVDVKDVALARAAMLETIAQLRDSPVSADLITRARNPLLEGWDNSLKTNNGWAGLVARAQSEADRLERQVKAKERLLAVTPADIQTVAKKYLTTQGVVEVTVLPEEKPAAVKPGQ
ncbi:MAG: hypothetical protein RLY97_1012, partial [Pseudomonadota bacterium]